LHKQVGVEDGAVDALLLVLEVGGGEEAVPEEMDAKPILWLFRLYKAAEI